MKTQDAFKEIDLLEKELSAVAPLVRQAFSRLPSPSAATEQAIRDEARRFLQQKRARSVWPHRRMLAAAAALMLLMGGGIQLHLSRQNTAAAAVRASHKESTSNLAALLLEIQGLNEDGFFRTEEAEPLWR